MENLNDEERKSLMALVEKGNKKKWGPEGQLCILGNGDITTMDNTPSYEINGMCGKTKDHAEYIRDNVFNYAWMIHAWLEVVGDWRPDWGNGNQHKWSADRFEERDIYAHAYSSVKSPGRLYFPSEEACDQWLEMIGDRLDGMLK
jgi:hypothetical protein